MPNRADLRRARKRRDELQERFADKVAEKEALEEKIARKRKARERHDEETNRHVVLDGQISDLMDQWRSARARARKLDAKHRRAAKRAKRIARKLRNRVSPKVIDLGFDRTAVRPLARQGTIHGSVGHYTAGPLDDDGDDESIALWRSFDRAHKAQGWSCLGYNIGITRDGTIVRLRGIEWVGAHTLNYNTGRVGISVHGTTGHTWAKPQLRALRKALKKYGLLDKPVIGHRQAPGQSTACPGSFLGGYNRKGR